MGAKLSTLTRSVQGSRSPRKGPSASLIRIASGATVGGTSPTAGDDQIDAIAEDRRAAASASASTGTTVSGTSAAIIAVGCDGGDK